MRSGDIEALAGLLCDEVRYIHSGGNRDDKARYLDSMRNGDLKYLRIDPPERRFSHLGPNVVLVEGRMTMALTLRGAETNLDVLFTMVWLHGDGGWRLRTWQSTNAPRRGNAAA
jgi:hypothetical protein